MTTVPLTRAVTTPFLADPAGANPLPGSEGSGFWQGMAAEMQKPAGGPVGDEVALAEAEAALQAALEGKPLDGMVPAMVAPMVQAEMTPATMIDGLFTAGGGDAQAFPAQMPGLIADEAALAAGLILDGSLPPDQGSADQAPGGRIAAAGRVALGVNGSDGLFFPGNAPPPTEKHSLTSDQIPLGPDTAAALAEGQGKTSSGDPALGEATTSTIPGTDAPPGAAFGGLGLAAAMVSPATTPTAAATPTTPAATSALSPAPDAVLAQTIPTRKAVAQPDMGLRAADRAAAETTGANTAQTQAGSLAAQSQAGSNRSPTSGSRRAVEVSVTAMPVVGQALTPEHASATFQRIVAGQTAVGDSAAQAGPVDSAATAPLAEPQTWGVADLMPLSPLGQESDLATATLNGPEASGADDIQATSRSLPFRAADGPLAAQIATMAASGNDRIEVQLDPVELGRITIEMTTDGAQVQVTVSADRPETLDLMRRHGDQLLQELRASGFSADTLNFGQSGPGEGRQDQAAAVMSGSESGGMAEPLALAETSYRPRGLMAEGGLDLRL